MEGDYGFGFEKVGSNLMVFCVRELVMMVNIFIF